MSKIPEKNLTLAKTPESKSKVLKTNIIQIRNSNNKKMRYKNRNKKMLEENLTQVKSTEKGAQPKLLISKEHITHAQTPGENVTHV